MIQLPREAGATVVTELTLLFFGDTVGRIRDPWDNIWWIQKRMEDLDWSELEKRMHDPTAMKAMQYIQESLDQAMIDNTCKRIHQSNDGIAVEISATTHSSCANCRLERQASASDRT